jgi:hypothetical protein
LVYFLRQSKLVAARRCPSGSLTIPIPELKAVDLGGQLESGLADRYRIERELGQGGMAKVFLA